LGDLNGDGTQDLVVANWGQSTVSVLGGDGAGGFGAAMNYATGSLPDAVAVADINSDGKADVAAANQDDNTASVLLNTTPTPAGAYNATADGLWYCHVCAVDGFGAWGPAATVAVRIDTHRPTTTARRAVVIRGRIASLRCGVSDARPCAGWAAVKVCVRNSRGKIVYRRTYSHKPTGWFVAKFRCKLAKGTYRYNVSATDAAGNRQSKLGWNRLIVK
ncbi:MAG: FG-GAP repeat domain-containing protein, partial [Thermoleophilia bacterium]